MAAPEGQRSASDETTSSSLKEYTKLQSCSDMSGELFEVKMLALLFLRGINANYEFHIASNFKAAGSFDDIVFRCRPAGGDGEWRTTFVQLKHKQRQQVKMSHLLSLSKKGDFSLNKYCGSYAQMKDRYGSEKELEGLGEFDKFEFVLYTNAPVDESMQQHIKSMESLGKNTSLLSTGSNGVIVSLLDNQILIKSVNEIVGFKSLLNEYTRATSDEEKKQTETGLNSFQVTHYKENKELYDRCKTMLVNTESVEKHLKDVENFPNLDIFKEFLSKLSMFTSQAKEDELDNIIKNEIVRFFHIIEEEEKETIRLFNDIFAAVKTWWQCSTLYLTENAQFWKEIQIGWMKHLSTLKHEEMLSLGITFRPGACDVIREVLPDAGVLNIVVSGNSTSVSASKLYQCLSSLPDRSSIFVGLQALLRDQDAILWAWQQKCCTALIIESEPGATSGELQKLAARLQSAIDKVPGGLVILVTTSDDALAGHLKSGLRNYHEYNDECRWNDLSEETRTSLLERTVSFQGQIVPLKLLVGQEETLTNQLKGDVLKTLLKGQLTFGLDLDCRVKYYIPRKLKGNGQVVDINSHSEVKSRVLLLLAEPGIGKSTLLTHLAKTAKDKEPTKWIVRINLLNCSTYLKTMKSTTIDFKSTVEFMKSFCLKDRNSSIEDAFFDHCLMKSGKMVVFIDAFDEICPYYNTEVCSIIRNLLQTKIETLWITSRLSEKDELEQAMEMQSFALESFTKEDQQNFLQLFWKERFETMEDKKITDFTDQVLQLAEDAFKGDNLVISIPQQTKMLAEFFEDNLANWQDPGARNKAMSLNILCLYQHFVQKKFDDYVKEKKRESTSNVAVISDNVNIYKNFLDNHKRAALMVFLSPDELSSLGVAGIQTDNFLSQISQGREKTGIIDRINNGKPNFIHFTFAEYFAALWFAENYSNFREFLQTRLFSDRFAVVKNMLDFILASGFELHTAVLNADHQTVNSLLLSNVDVNQTDAGGRTALHLVSAYRKTEKHSSMTQITKELLEHGASLDKLDDVMQWRPLHYADKTSKWTVAVSMLQNGGSVDDMDDTKENIHPEVFQGLTRFITNNNLQDYMAVMLSASTHGQVDVVRYLVNEFNADVNCRDADGTTCMHKAAQAGKIEVMRYLGNKGASYMDTDNKKYTPIMFAADNNHVEVVDYLLQKKAGITINNTNEMIAEGRNICLLISVYQGDLILTKSLLANNEVVASYVNKHGTTPLHWAAYRNDVGSVTALLSKKPDVNAKDKDGRTPLFKTVELKNTETPKSNAKALNDRLTIVRLLVQNGGTFSTDILHKSYSIIDCAIQNNHTNLVSFLSQQYKIHLLNAVKLCEKGDLIKLQSCTARGVRLGEIEMPGVGITSFLHYAVKSRNRDMVNYVLDNVPDGEFINYMDKENDTPLHRAVHGGYLDIAELLLDKGADIKSVNKNGLNLLHTAVTNKHRDVAELLLKRGASINSVNETEGVNCLHIAVKINHLETVQCLLKYGALVNSKDKTNATPLHAAAFLGYTDIAAMLLANGADVNSVDGKGQTSLHVAVEQNHLDVAKLLLINGALVNSIDKNTDTPIHHAAHKGFYDIAELLLDNGADLNSLNQNGLNFLHTAVSNKHLDVAKLFLKRGASVNSVVEPFGRTSLHIAVQNNHLECVQLLLTNGALVNSRDKTKATPLHAATGLGYSSIVALLMDHGADVNSVDGKSQTALHLAVKAGHLDVAKLLMKIEP